MEGSQGKTFTAFKRPRHRTGYGRGCESDGIAVSGTKIGGHATGFILSVRVSSQVPLLNLFTLFFKEIIMPDTFKDTDKLTEIYTQRIPEITKAHIQQLPDHLKHKLHNEILLVMAKIIHESRFDPSLYLKG